MSVASVSMSVVKTVQTNRDEFAGRLPDHGAEWAFGDTDLSWSMFRRLRAAEGDAVIRPVRETDDHVVWMTTRSLADCVRNQHGDVLVDAGNFE